MNTLKTLLRLATLWLVLGAAAHAGTVTYVYSDPQGTPLLETDAQGHVTATFDYRPYGAQALGTAPSGPGYTGHVNDPDTGLVYMQARYYDPEVGRFLSVDPVGPSAGDPFNFNRFAYVDDNPVGRIDPDGRVSAGDDASEERRQHVVRAERGSLAEKEAGIGAFMASAANTSGIFLSKARDTLDGGYGARFGQAIQNGNYGEASGFFVAAMAVGGANLISDGEVSAASEIGIVANGIRGRASEARVLEELGLVKNNRSVTTSQGTAIPDAWADSLIEIKDSIRVTFTPQIQIETQAARDLGIPSILITGEKTCVSGRCAAAFDQIIRRADLGPK